MFNQITNKMKAVTLLSLMTTLVLFSTAPVFSDSSPPGINIEIEYNSMDVDFEENVLVLEAKQEFQNNTIKVVRERNLIPVNHSEKEQYCKPVNKFGIESKEVCYWQDLNSYKI